MPFNAGKAKQIIWCWSDKIPPQKYQELTLVPLSSYGQGVQRLWIVTVQSRKPQLVSCNFVKVCVTDILFWPSLQSLVPIFTVVLSEMAGARTQYSGGGGHLFLIDWAVWWTRRQNCTVHWSWLLNYVTAVINSVCENRRPYWASPFNDCVFSVCIVLVTCIEHDIGELLTVCEYVCV